MALTKRRIDAFHYDGSHRDIRWDGEGGLPGFGVRVYPSGKKSFVLLYRKPGQRKQHLKVVGRYGVTTLEQARRSARRVVVGLEEGVDPLDRGPSMETSVTDFAEIYVRDHAKGSKKSWEGDQRRLKKHVVPAFGSRRLTEIKRPDLARFHQTISANTPIEANRVLALISHLFSKAEEWGYVPEGHPNPTRGIQKNKEKSRQRWLKRDEVKRLMKATAAEDVFVRAAIVLYLLTGVRKLELLSARWEDVDLERSVLRLRETKSGNPHEVHLSPQAAHVFRQLPREMESPWVFPRGRDGHYKDIKFQWARVREQAGLKDVRLHDLRRTVGSWMAQAGVPLQVIGKVLNHSDPSVTEVYARLADEQSKDALNILGERMGEVLRLPSLNSS